MLKLSNLVQRLLKIAGIDVESKFSKLVIAEIATIHSELERERGDLEPDLTIDTERADALAKEAHQRDHDARWLGQPTGRLHPRTNEPIYTETPREDLVRLSGELNKAQNAAKEANDRRNHARSRIHEIDVLLGAAERVDALKSENDTEHARAVELFANRRKYAMAVAHATKETRDAEAELARVSNAAADRISAAVADQAEAVIAGKSSDLTVDDGAAEIDAAQRKLALKKAVLERTESLLAGTNEQIAKLGSGYRERTDQFAAAMAHCATLRWQAVGRVIAGEVAQYVGSRRAVFHPSWSTPQFHKLDDVAIQRVADAIRGELKPVPSIATPVASQSVEHEVASVARTVG